MNLHHHRVRAEPGVTRYQRLAEALMDDRVQVIHGLHFEHGVGRHICQVDAAFDFRLRQIAVNFVAEVGVRSEQSIQLRLDCDIR